MTTCAPPPVNCTTRSASDPTSARCTCPRQTSSASAMSATARCRTTELDRVNLALRETYNRDGDGWITTHRARRAARAAGDGDEPAHDGRRSGTCAGSSVGAGGVIEIRSARVPPGRATVLTTKVLALSLSHRHISITAWPGHDDSCATISLPEGHESPAGKLRVTGSVQVFRLTGPPLSRGARQCRR